MYQISLFANNEELLDKNFLQTDLGYLHRSIPWEKLVSQIPARQGNVSGLGRPGALDVQGGIALQVLKHYFQCSDAQLMERFNTDWGIQLFCGRLLKPGERVKDSGLPSDWRVYLAQYLDIEKMQLSLAQHWKSYLEQTKIDLTDATCYESYIEYPTDIKLIWKGSEEMYGFIQFIRHRQKLRVSRIRYAERKVDYLQYQKCKKKTKKRGKKLRKKLLKFLARLIEQFNGLVKKYGLSFSKRKQQRIATIMKLYVQQHDNAYGIVEKIENRIVHIAKDYIRPIVRGKEVKPVEFGAKVNKIQVDGINFIEHLSYDAFNEGMHLESAIRLHRQLFGKCNHISADKIYATNNNRKYCKKEKITTNFIPKGNQKSAHIEQGKTMRKVLDAERATRLEGSFGNEKNHYLLKKVNARTKATETLWIFFGIHTANAVNIARRIEAKERKEQNHPPPERVLPLKMAA
jgi:hypothetical protein